MVRIHRIHGRGEKSTQERPLGSRVVCNATRYRAAVINAALTDVSHCCEEIVRTSTIYHASTSLSGTAPLCLADKCSFVTATGRRSLRSADS